MKKLLLATVLVATAATASDSPKLRAALMRKHYLTALRGIQRANNLRIMEYTQIRQTTFMGLRVMLHKAIHDPLHCVEQAIKSSCSDDYKPKTISGWRTRNSFRGQEISNHVFGTAIDLDPAKNTCCLCVKEWANVPLCKDWRPADDVPGPYEIPECWIEQFERYGFYWLGHDPTLWDTMHFEFLAKPGSVTCEGKQR